MRGSIGGVAVMELEGWQSTEELQKVMMGGQSEGSI